MGFLFNKTRDKVLLIRKVKPEWQAGHLNAPCGHQEEGELPHNCCSREFFEETGIEVPCDAWVHFLTLDGKYFKLRVFACESALVDTYKAYEGEEGIVRAYNLSDVIFLKPIPNLPWIMNMYLFDSKYKFNVTRREL